MMFTIGWIATFGIVVLGVMFVAGGLVHLSSRSEDRKMEKVALDRTVKREREKFLQGKKESGMIVQTLLGTARKNFQ